VCAPPESKKWHDPSFALNERLSDPPQGVLGRFISIDPIGHAGGLNFYSYPTNPVTFVDPAGLDPFTIVIRTKSAEIQTMNNALGIDFSASALARLWESRLRGELGLDINVEAREGFHPDCESNQEFVYDKGLHINLHFTDKKLIGSDPIGLSVSSRSRVNYRAVGEEHSNMGARYGGGLGSNFSTNGLKNAAYNVSMHELTHGFGLSGDHDSYDSGFLGTGYGGTADMRGIIMSPKMSVDPNYFGKLMLYGDDSQTISDIKRNLKMHQSQCSP